MADMRRAALVARMRKIRQDITQIFDDAEHWNRVHPDEPPLTHEDIDPGGELRRMAAGLEMSLAREEWREMGQERRGER